MDQLQTRLDALEHELQTLHHQTHRVTRQLRWWRILAGGLVVMGLLSWVLPDGRENAWSGSGRTLDERVAALETLLKHFSRAGNDVTITGANLHLVNGLGATDCGRESEVEDPIPNCPNGVGNLIVGYNEPRGEGALPPDERTGSHNIVVGKWHNFSRFGGIVVGERNDISGDFAVVSAGTFNQAIGNYAAVSGGQENTASGERSSVSGGGQRVRRVWFVGQRGAQPDGRG